MRFNPKTIECLTETIKAISDHASANDIVGPIYYKYLLRPVRQYYYYSETVLLSDSEYLKRPVKQNSHLSTLIAKYKVYNDYDHPPGVVTASVQVCPDKCIKFWQARKADGSSDALLELFRILVERYDPFFPRLLKDYRGDELIKKLRSFGCYKGERGSQQSLPNLSCIIVHYYSDKEFVDSCVDIPLDKIGPLYKLSNDDGECKVFIKALISQLGNKEIVEFPVEKIRDKDHRYYKEALGLIGEVHTWGNFLSGYLSASPVVIEDIFRLYPEKAQEAVSNNDGNVFHILLDKVTSNEYELRAASQGGTLTTISKRSEAIYNVLITLDFKGVNSVLPNLRNTIYSIQQSKVLSEDKKTTLIEKITKDIRYVVASIAKIRSKPSSNSTELQQVRIGTAVQILSSENDWSYIRYSSLPKHEGWVHSSLLDAKSLTEEEARKRYRETTDLQEKRKWAERAAAINPSSISALIDLLEILEQLGDTKSAAIVRKQLKR